MPRLLGKDVARSFNVVVLPVPAPAVRTKLDPRTNASIAYRCSSVGVTNVEFTCAQQEIRPHCFIAGSSRAFGGIIDALLQRLAVHDSRPQISERFALPLPIAIFDIRRGASLHSVVNSELAARSRCSAGNTGCR
jgi:hypothetical protein